jgi:hypothetical protein
VHGLQLAECIWPRSHAIWPCGNAGCAIFFTSRLLSCFEFAAIKEPFFVSCGPQLTGNSQIVNLVMFS